MNTKSVQGYIVAFGFLTYYKSENPVSGNLALIDKHLELINTKFKRNKINFEKHFKKGADVFENYCKENDTVISVLSFVVQLIIKNPNWNKNIKLTNLAKELSKEKMFSKEDSIRNSKILVNNFYYPEKYNEGKIEN